MNEPDAICEECLRELFEGYDDWTVSENDGTVECSHCEEARLIEAAL